MSKPVELKGASGVRNDVSPERYSTMDLVTGTNIELDETGAIRRRAGVKRVLSGAAHSLWASGRDAFVVLDGVLSRVTKTGTGLATTPIKAVAGARVAYTRIIDEVFWTDGIESGIINGNTSRNWGIVPPQPFGSGAGEYLYTATYYRADGTESGAPICGRTNNPAGVGVPQSSDPTVVGAHLYMSTRNGELLYRSDGNADAPSGPQLRTQFMGAAPAGQVVGHYKGRAYVASGRFLWYSAPFEFELFDLMSGYIAFPSDVKTFAPVSDGIFVGSETETVFLHGNDPAEFQQRQVSDYGTVLGTEKEIPEYYVLDEKRRVLGPQMMWASKHGICLGTDGGRLQNLTGGRYILPEGVVTGASLLKVRGGTPQLVVSLFS